MPSPRRGPVCLSGGAEAIKGRRRAQTGGGLEARANPDDRFHAWRINSQKSGSVNYEGACSLAPEEPNKGNT